MKRELSMDLKLSVGLPKDLSIALAAFVAISENVRVVLARAEDDGLAGPVQDAITKIHALTATARAYLPAVQTPAGKPMTHFVSSIYVPPGICFVTKNDVLLWTGILSGMVTAQENGNWPDGVTIHLGLREYEAVIGTFTQANVLART